MVGVPIACRWLTYPSQKYDESSVGMMNFPTEWKNKIHGPNHQPDMIIPHPLYPL